MTLESQIEAVLFWKAEPMKLAALAKTLGKNEGDVKIALEALEKNLDGRGVQLIWKDEEVMLGTRAELSSLIEGLIKEELVRDMGKAGLETLSIVLYRGPVSRRDVDYIRGVNSTFILRNLLVRGLVERVEGGEGSRGFTYQPTFQLLSYLGVSKIEDLPEFSVVRAEIDERTKAATQLEASETPENSPDKTESQ